LVFLFLYGGVSIAVETSWLNNNLSTGNISFKRGVALFFECSVGNQEGMLRSSA
jgi:hypothetical protein